MTELTVALHKVNGHAESLIDFPLRTNRPLSDPEDLISLIEQEQHDYVPDESPQD